MNELPRVVSVVFCFSYVVIVNNANLIPHKLTILATPSNQLPGNTSDIV